MTNNNNNIIQPRLLKGFRDYNPTEQSARQGMFQKIQAVFESFGFAPLSTPVLEYKEILMGKYGDEGEKLVYAFKDNGDRDVAMRYDLTVPLARYVAQNYNGLALPFKRYQIAPVWRADNPQKGRLREFYQCDVDAVGAEGALADAEIVSCICKALEAVGVDSYEVCLNDRSLFELVARSFLDTDGGDDEIAVMKALDKADKISSQEVLQLLQSQNVSDDAMNFAKLMLSAGRGNEALEKIADEVPDAADKVGQFKKLLELIQAQDITADKLVFSPSTVRGLDYYTGMVAEVVLKDNPEFGSIAGGGRYDSLLSTFSTNSVPAVGMSIGVDRLFEALENMGKLPKAGVAKVMVLNLDENLTQDYAELATNLRAKGVTVEVYYQTVKLDKQFKYAENKGIEYALLMGVDEKEQGVVQLKNLGTREQVTVAVNDLAGAL